MLSTADLESPPVYCKSAHNGKPAAVGQRLSDSVRIGEKFFVLVTTSTGTVRAGRMLNLWSIISWEELNPSNCPQSPLKPEVWSGHPTQSSSLISISASNLWLINWFVNIFILNRKKKKKGYSKSPSFLCTEKTNIKKNNWLGLIQYHGMNIYAFRYLQCLCTAITSLKSCSLGH